MVLAKSLEEGRGVVDQCIDAHELLEEHESYAYVCAAPAAALEAVSPGGDFELDAAGFRPVLQLGVALAADFFLEGYFGSDVIPFFQDSRVRRGKLAELG